MVSKKKCIGLSMLLLVFLLGLSTTAYASNFSETDFKNIIANAFTGFGTSDNSETIINNVFANTSYINRLLEYQDSFEYLYIAEYGLPTNRIDFYFGNDNTFHCYRSGNDYYFKGNGRYTLSINNSNYNFNSPYDNISSSVSTLRASYLIYSDRTIYSSSTGGDVLYSPGWFNRDFTEEVYFSNEPELYFDPIAPIGYRDFTVGQNLGLVVRGVTKNNTYSSMKFGDLYVPSYYYIKDIEVVWYYYNKNTGNWLGKYMLHEYGDDLTPDNYRSTIFNFKFEESFKENDTTIVHYSLWGNRNYVLENCVYQFEIQSTKFKDGTLEFDGNAFYILDSNTVIGENGVLDTGFLDTGPYSDQYLNDVTDTAKKVDELDDLINGVETGVGNLFLPASGDWFPLNNLASGDDLLGTAFLWGYKNYDNPYWTALYGLMNNILTTLTQTGNVEITFTLNGNNYTYNSNYLYLPDGPLKTWLSLATTFIFVVSIYRLFNRKLEKIKMADSTVLKYSAEDSNLL